MTPVVRATLLGVVAGAVGLFLYRNPPADPQPAQHTRYIKIDAKGQPLGPWKGPWKCVYDTQTHLLWEVKKDNESVHDFHCSFSWYQDGIGHPGGGRCFDPTLADTSILIQRTNQERRCGVTGWRLPTPDELRSLIQPPTRAGDPTIATDFFPFTQNGPYWTSQRSHNLKGIYARAKEGAVSIHFGTHISADKKVRVMPLEHTTFVRLVTPSLPPAIRKEKP
jgi:hypothetical protein